MTTHDDMKQDLPQNDADRLWADNHLEAWMDGNLTKTDKERFERLLVSDGWLQSEADRARMISSAFAGMHDARCPDDVTSAVMTHVRNDWVMQLPRRLREGFSRMASAGLRPALAMVLLLIVVLSSTQINRTPVRQDAEVAQALADVKMALAVLADAGKATGTTVSNEVIGPYVVRPMAKGMNSVIEN